jgi:hypothetical protein
MPSIASTRFTPSGQKARLGLQPLTNDAGTLLAISRPRYRKAVVDDVIGLYAERLFDELGRVFGVVSIDRLFEQVGHNATPF